MGEVATDRFHDRESGQYAQCPDEAPFAGILGMMVMRVTCVRAMLRTVFVVLSVVAVRAVVPARHAFRPVPVGSPACSGQGSRRSHLK